MIRELVRVENSATKASEDKSTIGRMSVHVFCCVSLLAVDKDCGEGNTRAYREVNEDVAIEYSA